MKNIQFLFSLLCLSVHFFDVRASEQITILRSKLAVSGASNSEKIDAVKDFLRPGADVNVVDNYGWTALIWAVSYGSKETVELLLEKGADVNVVNNGGWTALMNAAQSGSKEVVELLLEKGADVNTAGPWGQTALLYAVRSGSKEAVELLLEKGADIHTVNNRGETVLIYAAAELASKKTVELLLKKGAEVNATSNWGKTALMYAAKSGSKEAVELLLEKGADINVVDKSDQTALMYAAESGSKEVIELLLKKGADLHAVNKNGRTALEVAALLRWRRTEIQQLLKDYAAFKFITIDQEFDHEPKPEDYCGDQAALIGANDLIDFLDKDEERVNAFEKDLAAYWHNKVQKAYEQFVFKNNSEPLRVLLTQEVGETLGLIWPFFNSRKDFIYVLNELKNGANAQDIEGLQHIIEEEKYLEKRALAEIAEKEAVREIQRSAAEKIQHAFKKYKQHKQQKLSFFNSQKDFAKEEDRLIKQNIAAKIIQRTFKREKQKRLGNYIKNK